MADESDALAGLIRAPLRAPAWPAGGQVAGRPLECTSDSRRALAGHLPWRCRLGNLPAVVTGPPALPGAEAQAAVSCVRAKGDR